jgi:two-component system, cell cycle response regulator DivK
MISQTMSEWKVLIVDDEPDNVKVAQKILAYNGAEVQIARNGLEGLISLDVFTPTFILLDLSMPEMDGWEMLARVRRNTTFKHTPVIALTAHAMSGDREKVMQAGFNGYIAKPFRLNSFLEDIQRCLSQFSA